MTVRLFYEFFYKLTLIYLSSQENSPFDRSEVTAIVKSGKKAIIFIFVLLVEKLCSAYMDVSCHLSEKKYFPRTSF